MLGIVQNSTGGYGATALAYGLKHCDLATVAAVTLVVASYIVRRAVKSFSRHGMEAY